MHAQKLIRGIINYFSLDRTRRRVLREIFSSKLGLHGTPFTFFEDGLCTIHNSDFCKEVRFKESYLKGVQTNSWNGWPLRWRAYLYCALAEYASMWKGDFVECGVNLGGNARMLINYLPFKKLRKRFFLFDTFSGFDEKQLSKGERATVLKAYNYRPAFQLVKALFKPFHYVSIIQGSVPHSLTRASIKNVCFLSLDMNCVHPEIAAFRYFWPKLSTGGVVLLDDYGFKDHHEQKAAFDKLSRKMNFRIIQLPTGQGLIFKTNF
jgi:hypothetical protein